jgi:hypothetical protein
VEPKNAAIAAAVILAVSGGAFFMMKKPAPAPQAAVEAPMAPPSSADAVASMPPAQNSMPARPVSLPTLDDSDAYVRGRAPGLFTQAVPPPWLQAEGLLRRLVAAAVIVSEGESPRDSLGFLKPRGKFKVMRAGNRTVIDPKSYDRYNAVGSAAEALDVQAAARWIQEARPLLQQACAELNDANCNFTRALTKSAKTLLAVPVVTGDIRVREKVVTWTMTDAKLEGLSKAQKHLLRLGPRNQKKVQDKLRELALALGASPAELPQPRDYSPAP